MSFPLSKPERRNSSAGLMTMDETKSKAMLAQTLSEEYKEWLITVDKSGKQAENGDFNMPEKEHLGIACINSFILSMASDSRLPSNADLSRLISNLFAFAQSKRLTVLAIITSFENNEGSGYTRREIILWPLTSQAASKLAQLRKVESDPTFHWRFWKTDLYRAKLGLAIWDDAKYDPDHIVDRKKPLKKARTSSSLAFSEENFGEEDTWRRVWTLERKGANVERVAEYLIELLEKS